MRRADGAKAWAEVLSELARVAVTVEWEQPAWRVHWRDGPTRRVLMDRAAALGRFRMGSPLPFEQLRFTRSDSAVALALAWLAHGSPASPAHTARAVSAVEAFCDDTGFPQTRFDEATLGAAGLLARLGNGDVQQMGTLLAQAIPPVAAQHITTIQAGPDLPDRGPPRAPPATGGTPRESRRGVTHQENVPKLRSLPPGSCLPQPRWTRPRPVSRTALLDHAPGERGRRHPAHAGPVQEMAARQRPRSGRRRAPAPHPRRALHGRANISRCGRCQIGFPAGLPGGVQRRQQVDPRHFQLVLGLHTITVERGRPDHGQSSRQVGDSRARGLQRRRVLTHLGPLFRAVIHTGLRGPGTWS